MAAEKEFASTKEAARLLDVTPETVRDYVKQGKLRSSRLGDGKPGKGRPMRIPYADIDKLLAERLRAYEAKPDDKDGAK